jgi:tRNA-guanine transglycosylase
VVQGSVYKDLREESAKFISSLPFEGIAIGGVAVGESKEEMKQVLDWVMPILPKEKPVHLLGVGEIDDIFASVERGVDMFDCVMPTRLGRMGHILTKLKIKNEKLTPKPDQRSVQGYPVPNLSSGTRVKMTDKNSKFTFDITKSIFVDDAKPLEESCDCFVCRNFSRGYLNHLFRARELLAYRLASYHNLYFLEKLFSQIRKAIKKGEFLKLKAAWL